MLKTFDRKFCLHSKILCVFVLFFSGENNLIALFNLQMERPGTDKGRSLAENMNEIDEKVHKILQESVGSGKVGNLKLDPQYLVFEPQSSKKFLKIYN